MTYRTVLAFVASGLIVALPVYAEEPEPGEGVSPPDVTEVRDAVDDTEAGDAAAVNKPRIAITETDAVIVSEQGGTVTMTPSQTVIENTPEGYILEVVARPSDFPDDNNAFVIWEVNPNLRPQALPDDYPIELERFESFGFGGYNSSEAARWDCRAQYIPAETRTFACGSYSYCASVRTALPPAAGVTPAEPAVVTAPPADDTPFPEGWRSTPIASPGPVFTATAAPYETPSGCYGGVAFGHHVGVSVNTAAFVVGGTAPAPPMNGGGGMMCPGGGD